MKFPYVRWGLARSLVAISVSLTVVVSTQAFAFASLRASQQPDSSQSEFRLTAASATATRAGVLIQWQTNAAADNLGFNIYRLQDGNRIRVNREIVPGAVFATGARPFVRSGYSYSWLDRNGTSASSYYIESVSLDGTARIHEAISPAVVNGSESEQTPETIIAANALSPDSFTKGYPAAAGQLNFPAGSREDQWTIAGQSALKIGIKKDGWYRVTQAQMAAAGFNPTVDIRNLQLFVDALEVAINTSQRSGTFQSGDYIEFYGRGLDTTTTDTSIYYLIAGAVPGKRVGGEMQLDDSPRLPPTPTPTPAPEPTPASTPTPDPISSPTPAPAPTPTPISSPSLSPSPPTATPPQAQPTAPRADGPVLEDPIFYSRVDPNLFALLDLPGPGRVSVPRSSLESDNTHARNAQPDSAQNYDPQAGMVQPDISTAGETQPVASQERTATEGRRVLDDRNRQNALPSANNTRSLRLPVLTGERSPMRPVITRAAARVRKRAVSKKRKRSTARRPPQDASRGASQGAPPGQRNHAVMSAGFTPSTFDFTVERKDRTVYYSSLLNGDTENFFGQVISSNPANQTITIPNPDRTAAGPAKLEVAMQGVNFVNHQVRMKFNGTDLGFVLPEPPQSFFGQSHVVATFDVPLSLIQNGANTLTFSPQICSPSCPDTTIVDYARLTYPHKFLADSGSLRFNLRGTQTVTVDGFATPSVLLIDYTDPLAVSLSRPASAPSANGFAIDVPLSEPVSKNQRLLFALPVGQFDQPASLTLNQPSSLNLNSNTGDFLIIAHQDFLASVEPLRAARASQGLSAKVVDVEDVYDEFSFGEHGPEAIRNFLNHAATHWNSGTGTLTPPRYVVFVGDSSYDARDYANFGHYDFVPTKLIDATYNETVSDDWLTDFDEDGYAEIPVGRIPVRTAAEADLVVSKIINYVPANVPQTALLVADDPGTPPVWDFESGNDNVQALLLPAGMTVQRVNVRTEPSTAQATADISNGINQGRAIVNYSGHGNVNVWASSVVFTTGNASALSNGMNKLTFVIVMDCLNGYFQDPGLQSLSEAFLKAPNGGAVAAFASSGLTTTYGQRQMELKLYSELYGSQPIAVGDAIKIAKAASYDIDVRRTWIFFGDPSMKIR